MSEKTMWILKREITLCVGEDDGCSDIIRTIKSKQLFYSKKLALVNATMEQNKLTAAMKESDGTIMNIGGIIFDADDVKCAKIAVRKAYDYEIPDMTGACDGMDMDDEAECRCDYAEKGCGCESTGIAGARCIPDDEDDDEKPNADTGMVPPEGYGKQTEGELE